MPGADDEGSRPKWMQHSLYKNQMTRPFAMSIASLCSRSVEARKILSEDDIDCENIFDELWKSVLSDIYLVGGSESTGPQSCSNSSVREAISSFEEDVKFIESQAAAHVATIQAKSASKKRSSPEGDRESIRGKSPSLHEDDRGDSDDDLKYREFGASDIEFSDDVKRPRFSDEGQVSRSSRSYVQQHGTHCCSTAGCYPTSKKLGLMRINFMSTRSLWSIARNYFLS